MRQIHLANPMLKKSLLLALTSSLLLVACQSDPEVTQEPATSDPTVETSQEDTQTSAEIEWKTYISSNYGFSFEYPETWTLEEDTHARPYVLLTSPERLEAGKGTEGDQMILIDAKIRVYPSNKDLPNNTMGLSFDQWMASENTYLNEAHVSETTISGESGYLFTDVSSFDGTPYTFAMVEHNGKIYELNLNVAGAKDHLTERTHIFSSFQFVGSETSFEEYTGTITGDSVTCEDEACIYTKFEACEASTFSADMGFAAITYEIFGPKDGGCEMSLVYTKNPNPDWVDQPMTCIFDNTQDFQTAVGEQLAAAPGSEASTCSGPLVEVLANL